MEKVCKADKFIEIEIKQFSSYAEARKKLGAEKVLKLINQAYWIEQRYQAWKKL